MSDPSPPRGPDGRPFWRRYGIPLVLVYAGWCVFGFLAQRAIVFPRHFTLEAASPGAGFPDLERSHLETDQGQVEVWFSRGRGVSERAPGGLAVICHGNAELIDGQAGLVRAFHDLGISSLLVEFRGYGRSGGDPTQERLVDDLERALAGALRRPEVDPARVVFHGRSLGCAVACAVAAGRPPAAMVLVSPFTSLREMLAQYLLYGPCVRDPFDNLAAVAGFERPLLVVHGERDDQIPHEHGARLSQAAPDGRLVTLACGHNDIPLESAAYWDEVSGFLHHSGVLGDRSSTGGAGEGE